MSYRDFPDTRFHNVGASIIVPFYNEKKGIKQTIQHLTDTMNLSGYEYEIILVDDGSTDGSAEEIVGMPVQLLCHERNYGYGAALKTGVANASYQTVVITDADGTYPIEQIPHLIEEMQHYDMVVGARVGKNVHVPWLRRPAKWVIRQLASYLSGKSIPDLNSGLRAMRRSVVEKFLPLLPDGFSFTSTITLAMLTNNYRVRYVPIDYHQRSGKSKIRPIYETINFIQLIVRTITYFQPLKVFLPISLIMWFFCGLALLYRLVVGEGLAIVMTVLFVGGLQMLATGLIADLIVRTYWLTQNTTQQGSERRYSVRSVGEELE